MINVESIKMHAFRGIQNVTLSPGNKNFAVCGPNGTGKSGVVDALEFAITGSITRLTGQGMAGVSLKVHGPHVDVRDYPSKARVVLKAFIPALNKTVTIERSVETPNDPIITPNDPDVVAVVTELARHPEFALSRREIIKYVVAAPGDRSKEVQALLRLDRVEKVRQSLQTIANGCKTRLKQTDLAQQDAQTQLLKALGIPTLKKEPLLAAVNTRREALGLDPLGDLTANTSLKAGIGSGASPSAKTKISKAHALTEFNTLTTRLAEDESAAVAGSRDAMRQILRKLTETPALLRSLRREFFLRSGLELFDDDECPYCENEWDLEALREKVQSRLAQATEATSIKTELEGVAKPFSAALIEIETLLGVVSGYAKQLPTPVDSAELTNWSSALRARRDAILSFEDPEKALVDLGAEFRKAPAAVTTALEQIKAGLDALPDPSKEEEARDYLTLGQERLEVYREAKRQHEKAKLENELANKVLDAYNISATGVLSKIYADVEKDFTEYYRFVNRDDESAFQGKLTPSLGKLGFDVDFYGRGLFPPGAYHSEGHQDGMGLCLYLALMKHTLGDNFTFAVLDDVMMSVDAGHRREICALLKSKFPKTQFLITTHDPIWLQHMTTEQMITSKSSISFRKWTVDDGPVVWEGGEVWDEIRRDLENDDVPGAAATLRRYLEYVSGLLAHKLRASAEYRGDAQYDLGDLLPAVIAAWKKLLSTAQESAQSWKKKEETEKLTERQADFSAKVAQSNVEQWAINKSIHYNEWAHFQREDFLPVVEAFKHFLSGFRCEACGSFVYVSPSKGPREGIRCDCGGFNINLKKKS